MTRRHLKLQEGKQDFSNCYHLKHLVQLKISKAQGKCINKQPYIGVNKRLSLTIKVSVFLYTESVNIRMLKEFFWSHISSQIRGSYTEPLYWLAWQDNMYWSKMNTSRKSCFIHRNVMANFGCCSLELLLILNKSLTTVGEFAVCISSMWWTKEPAVQILDGW